MIIILNSLFIIYNSFEKIIYIKIYYKIKQSIDYYLKIKLKKFLILIKRLFKVNFNIILKSLIMCCKMCSIAIQHTKKTKIYVFNK